MGVLHGDADRDLKDTNLHLLSRDVAQLHQEMKQLFAHLSNQVTLGQNQVILKHQKFTFPRARELAK